jgi:uracil DNA glycosylase
MDNNNAQNPIPWALQFTIYSGKWGNQLIPRVSDERIQEIREHIRIHKIARANIPKESKHIRFNYLKFSQMKKRIEGMILGIDQYFSNPQSLLKDFYVRQKTLYVARLNFLENLRIRCREIYSEKNFCILKKLSLLSKIFVKL